MYCKTQAFKRTCEGGKKLLEYRKYCRCRWMLKWNCKLNYSIPFLHVLFPKNEIVFPMTYHISVYFACMSFHVSFFIVSPKFLLNTWNKIVCNHFYFHICVIYISYKTHIIYIYVFSLVLTLVYEITTCMSVCHLGILFRGKIKQ